MDFNLSDIKEWIYPVVFIAGGIVIGILFEILTFSRLKKVFSKYEQSEIILKSLKGLMTIIFTAIGIYGSIIYTPMSESLKDFLPKALRIIAIILITLFSMRFSVALIKIYSIKSKGILPSTSIFVNFTKILIFIIGGLILLQSFGISIAPILTALGVGGLAVALALQDTLSNFFSGFHIIASNQLKPGDFVRLESGEEGYVQDITWKNTTIKALPNNVIIVPNSKISSSIITNFYQPVKELSVLIQVGISYESDLEKAEKVTIEVAKEVLMNMEGGVKEFEPFIRYHTFADFSINFNVILRVNEFVDQYPIKHEFIKRLHERYKKEGIEIPFPIRTVHMQNNKS